MRIHYSGPDVVVTSELFVRCVPWETFTIRDLRNVGVTRDDADRSNAATFAGAGAVLAAGALIYSVAGLWLTLAMVGLAALPVALFGVLRRRPQRLVLRAEYRGVAVELFSSADAQVFNQVKRALLRAMENGLPAPWAA
ncbi:hypothetical protein HH310_39075 [Actinoplanes sp. TBRC 11911]|uniref:DUF6232 family protein n=1 Tax=Actinoplanes sp. TBRC 11911 TaxID=2729386 RepID=UPI00145F405B|nr:DUF6232 family protein [Actinoplanes sp. TBRC 11911]NMO57164.1 hypothetical protein [Actinoplanes sp. TBRC 11911]